MAVKRCGSVVARSPLRSTRKPRKSHRPFLKTWTTSMPMHAASANASACTGDGPACEALSSVICTSPDRPPNTRSCSQTSETLVGGFAAIERFYRGPQINTVSGRIDLFLRRGNAAQRRNKERRERAQRSEPRERSEPAKRLARERVGESEGRSPSE